MQYNCHVEKYHYGDIGGIEKEQFREYKDKEKYKNYGSRRHFNKYFVLYYKRKNKKLFIITTKIKSHTFMTYR